MFRIVEALLRRRREPAPHPQGEEYEILQAERRRKEQQRRFIESAAEKMSHLSYPFKRDPFD